MQRRNFISNLAVILPAGIVAPKLLLGSEAPFTKQVNTKVLILGGGQAALFIAQKLKKGKIETIVLEPSGGISQSAMYNHTVKAGVIRQTDKHAKANVMPVTARQYSEVEDMIALDFVPTAIKRTNDGFVVTNGTVAYTAQKLVVALPVRMDTSANALTVEVTQHKKSVVVCCKKKNKKDPAIFRTVPAEKIDEQVVMQFAAQSSNGILAIL